MLFSSKMTVIKHVNEVRGERDVVSLIHWSTYVFAVILPAITVLNKRMFPYCIYLAYLFSHLSLPAGNSGGGAADGGIYFFLWLVYVFPVRLPTIFFLSQQIFPYGSYLTYLRFHFSVAAGNAGRVCRIVAIYFTSPALSLFRMIICHIRFEQADIFISYSLNLPSLSCFSCST